MHETASFVLLMQFAVLRNEFPLIKKPDAISVGRLVGQWLAQFNNDIVEQSFGQLIDHGRRIYACMNKSSLIHSTFFELTA